MNTLLEIVVLVLLLIYLQVFITCFCNYFNIDTKVTREDWLNFFRGLWDFFGGAYRRYVKRANENAQKQRRLDEIENFRNEWYLTFAWLLLQAIIATKELTGLVVPNDLFGLLVSRPVTVGKNGVFYLRFRGWNKPGYYMSVKQIQAQLNVELQGLCERNNIPLVQVADVRRCENNRILFALAFAYDIRAAKQAAQNTANITQEGKEK